ncbi:MAG: hypothetical protein O2800_01445 [Planctomycetota bacterium]|nr:hypothetical protein [Planctomycetota bacterium]
MIHTLVGIAVAVLCSFSAQSGDATRLFSESTCFDVEWDRFGLCQSKLCTVIQLPASLSRVECRPEPEPSSPWRWVVDRAHQSARMTSLPTTHPATGIERPGRELAKMSWSGDKLTFQWAAVEQTAFAAILNDISDHMQMCEFVCYEGDTARAVITPAPGNRTMRLVKGSASIALPERIPSQRIVFGTLPPPLVEAAGRQHTFVALEGAGPLLKFSIVGGTRMCIEFDSSWRAAVDALESELKALESMPKPLASEVQKTQMLNTEIARVKQSLDAAKETYARQGDPKLTVPVEFDLVDISDGRPRLHVKLEAER